MCVCVCVCLTLYVCVCHQIETCRAQCVGGCVCSSNEQVNEQTLHVEVIKRRALTCHLKDTLTRTHTSTNAHNHRFLCRDGCLPHVSKLITSGYQHLLIMQPTR